MHILTTDLLRVAKCLAQMDALLDDGSHSFDPWSDDAVVFSIGKKVITAGDLRAARKFLEKTEAEQ